MGGKKSRWALHFPGGSWRRIIISGCLPFTEAYLASASPLPWYVFSLERRIGIWVETFLRANGGLDHAGNPRMVFLLRLRQASGRDLLRLRTSMRSSRYSARQQSCRRRCQEGQLKITSSVRLRKRLKRNMVLAGLAFGSNSNARSANLMLVGIR
jgi:hypothetical protein